MINPTPQTTAPPDFNPWWVRLPLLVLFGGLLLCVLLLALLLTFQSNYAERVLPGVSAFGVRLEGLTREQAITALSGQFTFDDRAVFTFRDGERYWQYTAGELGIQFDASATVDAAFDIGRQGNPITRTLDQGLTWLNGEAVRPVITYDQTLATEKLIAIAREIDQGMSEGLLRIEGLEVIAVSGQGGRRLDIPATLDSLNQVIVTLNTGAEIDLVIRETPSGIANVESAAQQLRAALAAPLTLKTEDNLGPWTISREQIAASLQVQLIDNGDGSQRYEVAIDFEPFRPFLESLAPGLITQPIDGRFHFNDVTRQLEVIRSSVGGRSLNIDRTIAALEAQAFNATQRDVFMAFDYLQPRYHNNVTASELGISEMVIEATTSYAGSEADRRNNIAVGAALYDGIIIGPGEEFSFNYWLGDLSEEAGFTEGNVIYGGRTVKGIGGGICQVSTTIFRAAFKGGYLIIERNAHPYRVGYYEHNSPPGLDAAIWTPDRDFRFQNDTPYHLLLETEVFPASNTLQFRLYSTPSGRQVEIQQPIIRDTVPARETRYEANPDLNPGEILQVDYAAEGADVTVIRIVRDSAGNVLREDSIYTHYLPWGAIFQVAPGDSRLGG
ncbi:MAG: VanW family protein [Anaerolineae bacterium]|jgi:vancomycin resistance protein YoaR|nr:VanW family protein [Anaerolineae bacterium]